MNGTLVQPIHPIGVFSNKKNKKYNKQKEHQS